MSTTRRRHYIISLQLGGGHAPSFGTLHGIHEGDGDEDTAFEDIWRAACRKMSAETGLDWTTSNALVLFYRLADLP